ncbi:hypothetical protein P0W64_22520, partial [Tsukamurella sp. 8F]|uniref:hypothetical protein n=1 Tax=Tsukamurella sp. 8F TaxID=3031961 RepID=UPI0023B888E8
PTGAVRFRRCPGVWGLLFVGGKLVLVGGLGVGSLLVWACSLRTQQCVDELSVPKMFFGFAQTIKESVFWLFVCGFSRSIFL